MSILATAIGTGNTQTVALNQTINSASDILVFVNALKWTVDSYSISGPYLTIRTNRAGDKIEVYPASSDTTGGDLPDFTLIFENRLI